MTHSYSDLLTAQRCLKKYEYSVLRNLQKKARNVNLGLGIIIHELLMGFYQGRYDEALAELRAQGSGWIFDDEIATFESLLAEGESYVERYLQHHLDEWEILHVEESFRIELDTGEAISFTPDLVIRDSRGVWCVDHKSAASLPNKGEVPTGNFQAFLYSAALREIYGEEFRGFIFNFIRKKLPTQPRLTKTGNRRVADINRIDTDFETLRDFLLAEAPDLLQDGATQRRLAELKDSDRFFWREYVFTDDTLAANTLADAIGIVGVIDRATEQDRWPRTFLPYSGAQDCSRCPFSELCIAEMRGYNTENIMYLYEERDMSHRQYDHTVEVLDV